MDQMLRNSQVVAAFGRRLFDETELKESTTDEEDQEDGEEVQTDLFPPGSPVTSAALSDKSQQFLKRALDGTKRIKL